MYAVYQKITNGYYRRIYITNDAEDARVTAAIIPDCHVEKIAYVLSLADYRMSLQECIESL